MSEDINYPLLEEESSQRKLKALWIFDVGELRRLQKEKVVSKLPILKECWGKEDLHTC